MSTELWFLAMGVAIPAVCLITVSTALFLMKRKNRKKEPESFFKELDFNQLFGDSLQNQILCQQLDRVFDTIVRNIEAERLKIKEMLTSRMPAPAPSTAAVEVKRQEPPPQQAQPQEPMFQAQQPPVTETPVEPQEERMAPVQENPLETIHSLSRRGVSNREIAKNLNRPQAEIDLILKLRKMDSTSEKPKTEPRIFHASV